MRRLFVDTKKLKAGVDAEAFIDQVLAMDAAHQLKGGPKDVKALLDRFTPVIDQLPATAKEKINAILDRLKTSAAEEAVNAIRDLADKGKHKDAVARFLEWAKNAPQDATWDGLANDLYKSFMAEGWTKYWDTRDLGTELTVANGASGIAKATARGEVTITSPMGNTALTFAGLRGVRGIAFEVQPTEFKTNRGVFLTFSRRDDRTYKTFALFSGSWKISERSGDSWKTLGEAYLGTPAVGRSIEFALFTAGDFAFFFLDGKLVHRTAAADLTLTNQCQAVVEETNAVLKGFRALK
jgi:hypothetical protein